MQFIPFFAESLIFHTKSTKVAATVNLNQQPATFKIHICASAFWKQHKLKMDFAHIFIA
jgi:hypothetical protein